MPVPGIPALEYMPRRLTPHVEAARTDTQPGAVQPEVEAHAGRDAEGAAEAQAHR
jgi:hypothetical protein